MARPKFSIGAGGIQPTNAGMVAAAPTRTSGPTAGLSVPLNTPEGQANQQQNDFQSQWRDIMNSQAGNLAGQLSGVEGATAAQGRQMANMNALAGRSVGGAFAGGAAQTALGGAQMAQDIRAKHGAETTKMRLGWLQSQIDLAERAKDRAEASKNWEESKKWDLTLISLNNEAALAAAGAAPKPETLGGTLKKAGGWVKDKLTPSTKNLFNPGKWSW